ncbi:DUF397 domain-containing protein [Kitasatospora sp. NPDC004669]|uniref:DUF397 domain-containing protein n=1 Tax=Kitasatospora TaxID=2063 RepID=UPI0033B15E22
MRDKAIPSEVLMDKVELYGIDLSGVAWRKSSFSFPTRIECVEVARLPGDAVALRDSKSPEREPLRFTAGEWSAFCRAIEAGEFQF